MIVVSDTSPVLSLARIGRLELLRLLYEQVLIPSAVHDELLAATRQLPTPINFDFLPWLVIARPSNRRHVEKLCEDLDIGGRPKLSCWPSNGTLISSSWTKGADGARPPRPASQSPVSSVWSAHAKCARLIDAAKPLLDELIGSARFWISPALYREVLDQLGES